MGGERGFYQIITSCDEVGFVRSRVVVQTINTLLVPSEAVIAVTLGQRPNL